MLPLLVDVSFVILIQEALEMHNLLLAVDGSAHPLCYLRREAVPNDSILHLFINLILQYIV